MADVRKTVEILFGATDSTGGALASFGSGLDTLEGRIHDVTGPLADLNGWLYKIDTALAAAGAALIGFSVNEAGKFETAVNEINTLLSITPEQFDQFRGDILAYAGDSTQSIEAINGAVYSAISAGVAYQDSINAVRTAEKLAVAGKADLNSTTILLASTMNAYNLGMEEATRVSDGYFTTVRLGQTTIPELAQSMAQVTGIAANAGVEFETLVAAIAALTAKGLPTAEAVTAIKGAIGAILTPTKEAADLAAELGIEFNVAALESKGLEGVLQDVYTATEGNTEQVATLFGNIRGLNAVLGLVATDGGTAFHDKLEQILKSAGATNAAFQKMIENFDLINQQVLNNLKATLIVVGERILPEYKDTAQALAGVFNSLTFSVADGAFDPLFDQLGGFADDLQAWFNDLAQNLGPALQGVDWSGFTAAIGDVAEAVASLFEGVDVSTPEKLAAAIQGIVDSGTVLANVLAGQIGALKDFIYNVVVPGIAKINEMEGSTGNLVGQFLQWSGIVDKLVPGLGVLAGVLQTTGGALQLMAATGTGAAGAMTAIAAAGSALAALGLAAVVTAAGVALGVLLEKTTGIGSYLNDVLVPGADTLGTKLYDLLHPVDETAEAFARQREELERFERASAEYQTRVSEIDDANRALMITTADVIDTEEEHNALIDEFNSKAREQGAAIQITKDGLVDLAIATRDSLGPTKEMAEAQAAQVIAIKDAEGNVIGYRDALNGITTSYKKSTEATKEAKKETDEYRLKMEELASNERIALIENKIDLNIAHVEANAAIAVAAIDSIAASVESTNALIGDLFSHDAPDWDRFGFETQQQIEAAEDRAQALTDAQVALIEAEADKLQAQTDILRNGGTVWKIEADGLEPELEAFMFKLLERIQIRAVEDQSDFLLGLS